MIRDKIKRRIPYIRYSIFVCAAIFAMALCYGILTGYAQQTAAPAKYTEVKYSADSSSYKWEGDDRILMLAGNVKFVQGDTILTADRVDYREQSGTATAAGNLKIRDDRNSASANTAVVYFKEKKGSMFGNVVMTIIPKPAADQSRKTIQSQMKGDITITCEKLDYFYKEKRTVVPSAVKIVQEQRTLTADSAVFSNKDEILELTGNVNAQDGKDKHNFTSPKVRISLKEDNQWIEADKASGTFYIKDEDIESPAEDESQQKSTIPTDNSTKEVK